MGRPNWYGLRDGIMPGTPVLDQHGRRCLVDASPGSDTNLGTLEHPGAPTGVGVPCQAGTGSGDRHFVTDLADRGVYAGMARCVCAVGRPWDVSRGKRGLTRATQPLSTYRGDPGEGGRGRASSAMSMRRYGRLAVHPSHRRRGLGRGLVPGCLDEYAHRRSVGATFSCCVRLLRRRSDVGCTSSSVTASACYPYRSDTLAT